MAIIGVGVMLMASGGLAHTVMYNRDEKERSKSYYMYTFIVIIFLGIPLMIFQYRDYVKKQNDEPQQETVQQINKNINEEGE